MVSQKLLQQLCSWRPVPRSSFSRLHFPETHATPHTSGANLFQKHSVLLRDYPLIMEGAYTPDVSRTYCENFGRSLYLCLGISRTKLQMRNELLGLPQAVSWREIREWMPFSLPVPIADYISQKRRRILGSPFFCLRDPRCPGTGKCTPRGLGPC